MDLEEDKDLLYIAKEGLKAPLPEPWKACRSKDSEIYYFNFETGESTWEHPLDEFYKKQYLEVKALRNRTKDKREEAKIQKQLQMQQKILGSSQKPEQLPSSSKEETPKSLEAEQTSSIVENKQPNLFENEMSEIIEEDKGLDEAVIEEDIVFEESTDNLGQAQMQNQKLIQDEQASSAQTADFVLGSKGKGSQQEILEKPAGELSISRDELAEKVKEYQEEKLAEIKKYSETKEQQLLNETNLLNTKFEQDASNLHKKIDNELQVIPQRNSLEEEEEALRVEIEREYAEKLNSAKEELITCYDKELEESRVQSQKLPGKIRNQDVNALNSDLSRELAVIACNISENSRIII